MSNSKTRIRHVPLPTSAAEFWEAFLVIRNYLVIYCAEQMFDIHREFRTFTRKDGVKFEQRYDLGTAFQIMDFYYQEFILAREESKAVKK